MSQRQQRMIAIIPTYNEAANIVTIVARLRQAVPSVDVLIVDDNSPDGTGQVADRLAAADEAVSVLHRAAKSGLGRAYVGGFRWALERGYDVLIEMDADGSHQPEQLPRLIAALQDADVVIGARWVRGGEVVDWSKAREALSRGGNFYIRVMLGMPLRDATAGFRAYRAAVLQKLDLDDVASEGYCFQVDLSRRTYREGFRIVEVPITFVERQIGESKMSSDIVRESLVRVTQWGFADRAAQARRALISIGSRLRRS